MLTKKREEKNYIPTSLHISVAQDKKAEIGIYS